MHEPIKFRTTTVTSLQKRPDPARFLSELVMDNAYALEKALIRCDQLNIKAFRVNSQFCPAYTHPKMGYTIEALPNHKAILKQMERCRQLSKQLDMRLSFHPDQFVVLNTPREDVLKKSLEELEYQSHIADLIGADVVNIHVGGVYGNKTEALGRFEKGFEFLSLSAKKKLTLENDDKSYTPSDILPLCQRLSIPFVYDVHHHRCLKDTLSEQEATHLALKTWNREPLFHLSSPINGWDGTTPFKHHAYINVDDFPREWLKIDPLTIEIEAKAKEDAVVKLMKELAI